MTRAISLLILCLFCVAFGAFILSVYSFDQKSSSENLKQSRAYSFFVAGHVYGKPGVNNKGFHPPFRDKVFKLVKDTNSLDLGVLTGDVVRRSTEEEWRNIDKEIDQLAIPIHIAPGNHDKVGDIYEQRVDSPYYSFTHGNDLFIILSVDMENWSITGKQLDFFRQTIGESKNHRNVFIFMHQIAWWEKDNSFRCLQVNSKFGKNGLSNFNSEVMPLLRNLDNEVYVFAGDNGAFLDHAPSFHQEENVRLIASGMGGGNGNFLHISVGDTVDLDLIWLNDLDTPGLTQEARDIIAFNKSRIQDYQADCSDQGLRSTRRQTRELIQMMNAEYNQNQVKNLRAGSKIEINFNDSSKQNLEAYYDIGSLNLIARDCESLEGFKELMLHAYQLKPSDHGGELWGPLRSNLNRQHAKAAKSIVHAGVQYCISQISLKHSNVRTLRGIKTVNSRIQWSFSHNVAQPRDYIEANRHSPIEDLDEKDIMCSTLTLLCFENASPETQYVAHLNKKKGVFPAQEDGELYLRSKLLPEQLSRYFPNYMFETIKPVGSKPAKFLEKYKNEIVIITVKNDAIRALKPFDKDSLLKKGLDLRRVENRGAHVAILNPDSEPVNITNNSAPISLDQSSYQLKYVSKIESAGYETGDYSRVILAGKQESPNRRGLNIVVVNNKGRLIAVESFDTSKFSYRTEGTYIVRPVDH